MELLTADSKNILKAAQIIKNGGLVAFPTETVYGLGADGLSSAAAAKIFDAKNRPSFNPLILHIADKEDLEKICLINSELIYKVIDKFWPGPLTLVLPKKDIVPDIVTAGNTTVAVRMPDHKVAAELIRASETPIAAPSANVFTKLSPTTAKHVAKQLGEKIDIILDGGKSRVGVESTIISFENGEVFLLRPGGLPAEDIEKVTGKLLVKTKAKKITAPGMLPFHYAPSVPIYFLDETNPTEFENKKTGALLFSKTDFKFNFSSIKILSEKGDFIEAAANLFSFLHEFENEGIEVIFAEKVDEQGLGRAIMDRLRKAVKKYEKKIG